MTLNFKGVKSRGLMSRNILKGFCPASRSDHLECQGCKSNSVMECMVVLGYKSNRGLLPFGFKSNEKRNS
jgi:hypothetical protein